jgi:hypothetical protein
MAEQSSFCVFRYISIPPVSLITKAHIYFTSFDTLSGVGIDAVIYFADEDNASPPTDKTDLDGRSLTSSVSWPSIEDWYDNKVYKTPDLKDILQEVIDRNGWTENYSVMAILKVTDGPDSGRIWSAREYLNGLEKACLRVWWREAGQIQTPYIEPEEEFRLAPFSCEITTYPTDADIYYTEDGTDPDQTDTLYSVPFEINEDTVVKARAYKQYWITSDIATRNYVMNPIYIYSGFGLNQTFWRWGTNKPFPYDTYWRYNGFVAFRTVTVPPGANITSAYLRFYVEASSTGATDIYLRFQNVSNAYPPINPDEYITKLANSTAGTLWQPGFTVWNPGTWRNSPDFISDFQAIVDRPGWVSGNTVLLFLDCMHYTLASAPFGSIIRIGRQRVSLNADYQPELHVTWTGGSGIYYPGSYLDDGELTVKVGPS